MTFIKQHIFSIIVGIIVTYLSVMWVEDLPKIEIPNVDKPVHFLMYATFTISILLDRALLQRKKIAWWYLFAPLAAMAYGGLMEIVQHFLYWRSASIWDFLANDIGATIGTAGFALIYFIITRNPRQPRNPR